MVDQEPREEPQDDAFQRTGDQMGKFLILSELGRGSMGVVYKAFQDGVKREVALKVLPANITLDEKTVRRFHREVESVGKLNHSNIIQIYENGNIDGHHYFAMEMVDGVDFGAVRANDKAGVLRVARLIRDAARGLAHAHERGVIHRDIKPSNLMLAKGDRVVVTDFGLARIKDSASLTSTDAVVGTPKYMSPEQVLPGRDPIDGRADVYSLGATLFECLTDRPPLEAPSITAFFRAIIEERPSSPRRLNKACPHDLATITLRCLEKAPGDRYATAAELADDLDRFLSGEQIKARPKGATALALGWVRRHKVITSLSAVALIASMLVALLGGAVKKQTDRVELLSLVHRIRTSRDLELAVGEAEDLARRYPHDNHVAGLLAELYGREGDAALGEADPNWVLIVDKYRRAGRTGDLWYLMGLIQAGRAKEAEEAARALPTDGEPATLTRARLDIAGGNPAQAVAQLSGRAAKPHAFSLLVMGRARHALARDESDAVRKQQHLGAAHDHLTSARGPARERWLRSQIQLELFYVNRLMGKKGNLRDQVDDFGVIAKDWWGKVSGVWEGMTTKDVSNLRKFIERILALAGLPKSLAIEMETEGEARLKRGSTTDKVIGQLLLGAAKLSSRDMRAALDWFQQAESEIDEDERLLPYALWGKSIVYRAQQNLRFAVSNSILAVVGAILDKATFKDMEHLARHTALILQEAKKQNVDTRNAEAKMKTELEKLSPPPDWVSEVLSQLVAR